MARYRILIKASAAKELENISSQKDRRRIVKRIVGLATDLRPAGSEKLTGKDWYRIRQGDYRIIYSIEDDVLIVHIVRIGNRKDIYRRDQ